MDARLQNIINNARIMAFNDENRPQLISRPHFGTRQEIEHRFQMPSARPERFTRGNEDRFEPMPTRSERNVFNNRDQSLHPNIYASQEQSNEYRARVSLPQPTLHLHEPTGANRFELLQDLHSQRSSTDRPSRFSRPIQTPFYQHNTIDQDVFTPPRQVAHLSSSPLDHSSPTRRLSIPKSKYSTSFEHSSQLVSSPTRPTTRKLTDPPVANGIQLVPTNELPDRFRQIFPFQLFNAVQSKCFLSVYHTTQNIVVSAPTGSGKTAIMELAICQLVGGHDSGQFKIVYQAPTKSLCAERVRDWRKKFSTLNLQCAELTGDTEATEMRKVGNATIIVTTPEKWDSITRKWKDYIKLLQMVKLFLIDEVHILKEARGATLEAVVSRMKSIGTQVRFVALSATVPNSEDIAAWLGRDSTNGHLPAHRETFGEEFRPVKLQKHVYGFDPQLNDFAFDAALENKLPAIVENHTHGKPIMVFCFTRKSCESTAAKLSQWWVSKRVWSAPTQKINVISKELAPLVGNGVAFHHAGLDVQDRNIVEAAFLNGQINVICCTSTLAVGVNLPCHLVIIKGTVAYTDTGLSEYSDLEIMQMLGRAGRPQFDDSAVAVIMTKNENVDKYTKMISGQEVLESTLHLNLVEHLNSEVVLGTVYDISSAKKWLAGTFLSVRMRRNPAYYKFGDSDERLQSDIKLLQDTKLITDRLKCTEYGEAMARYMIQFPTMKLLLTIPKAAKIGQMLHIICQAVEFSKDLRMKANERGAFRDMNKSALVRFPIKENISSTAHKVSLMIQVQLGGIDLPNEVNRCQYISEKGVLLDRINRLVKCVVDCKIADGDGTGALHALELARSVAAGYWENMPVQLRQIQNLGAAATRKLVQGGVNSVLQLASMDSASIERVMSRNPPFGQKILDQLKNFPQLKLEIARGVVTDVKKGDARKSGVGKRKDIRAGGELRATWKGAGKEALTFVATSGDELVHFWRGKGDKEVRFKAEGQVNCLLACDRIVGTAKTASSEDNGDMCSGYFDTHDDVDDFMDIDDLHPKMENGKWKCNHPCSGQTLKNGQACKHKCCHEGLDKPRKAVKKGLNFGAVVDGEVETVDLVGEDDWFEFDSDIAPLPAGKLRKETNGQKIGDVRTDKAETVETWGEDDGFDFDSEIDSLWPLRGSEITSPGAPSSPCTVPLAPLNSSATVPTAPSEGIIEIPAKSVPTPPRATGGSSLSSLGDRIDTSDSAVPDSIRTKRAASPMESSRAGPIWLDQIDAEILAQFAGLVEFVD